MRLQKLSTAMSLFVALMLGGLGLYEALVHSLWPEPTGWYSQAAAVFIPLVIASLVVYYLLSVHDTIRRRMQEEMDERLRVEKVLMESQQELERRVEERTADLSRLNAELMEEIGDRKRVESELLNSEARLDAITAQMPCLLWTTDRELRLTHVVGAAHSRLDFNPYDFLGMSLHEVLGAADPAEPMVSSHLAALEGASTGYDAGYLNRNFEVRIEPLRDGHGEIVGCVGLAIETTDRKKVEDALRHSESLIHDREAKLDSIFRAAPAGIGMVIDRVLQEVNDTICKMTGYSREELVGQSARVLYPTQEDFEYVGSEKYRQIRLSGTGTVETRWKRKDGGIIDVLLSSSPVDQTDSSRGVTFTALDITERKLAAEALERAKTFAENLVETANAMVIGVDAEGSVTVFNREAERITGYSRDEVLERNLFDEWGRSGEYQYLHERFVQWQNGKVSMPLVFENLLYTKNGEELFVSWRINDLRHMGRLSGLIGFGMNITERKHMEQEMVARNQELLLLRELSETIQRSRSLDDAYRDVVEQVSLATGFPLVALETYDRERDVMLVVAAAGMQLPVGGLEVPVKETLSGLAVRDRRPLVETEPVTQRDYENSFLRGLGVKTYVSVPLLIGDRAIGALSLGHVERVQVRESLVSLVMALANEIAAFTDRRRIGEALARSEEKYRTLVESSSDAILMLDAQRNIVSMNAAFSSLFGYDATAAIGSPARIIHPSDESWQAFGEEAYLEIERHSTFRAEWDLMRMDGSVFPAETVTSSVRRRDGSLAGYVAIIRDVTERRKVMGALTESEERYRKLVEKSPDPILVHEFGNIVFANPAAASLFGAGAPDELLGRDAFGLVHPDYAGKVRERWTQLGKGATDQPLLEQKCLRVDGGEVWVEAMPVSLSFCGQPAVLTLFRDITERKRSEERILASLQEKEVLLKEIHHRVKNNLQIISSLLYLQSRKIGDNQVLQVLQESQGRIKSMALIHEKLYHSHDFTQIDFAEYIKSLVGNLVHTYKTSWGISLRVDVGRVALGLDRAIPLGLIINELVSNALKYAFPDERGGEIIVSLQSTGKDEETLVVSDNGVGFPEDLDFEKSSSLGLQLVCTLARQVEGAIRLDRNGGTTFTVTMQRVSSV